ncbi:putative baseplate assembly protein [Polymorphobacter fuscus]|uniref:Putative baseplate assembly protein n=1 Tax=Sandarakinorhabdus fusca TaxID=1439888 RepID=A0A7C9GVE8_9SPHN|nr:putative baseplate assembly protein [Polymorphobacter fuscus]KAB7647943.1 putative baseplate assembly protein [Polymorphobacter fuscus]MQT17269.1 putative baseplate assembly protein [Polymorphobacter fuscus]NJC08736.1 hypothetical protein [Polymorphobacter fuscus]
MTPATAPCCTGDARRAVVRAATHNGFDYVEVDCAQTLLTVTFLGRAPDGITPAHLVIEGGRRERDLRVLDVRIVPADDEGLDDVMLVRVDRPGDFSNYRLRIIDIDENGHPTGRTPAGFDPRYTSVGFGFKAGCPVDQDPADTPPCPVPVHAAPALDYLARDYQGFRQLLLDRLALTMPGWTERHAPDLGITLVEILAYAADDLSYYQDAVATEAFLGTARLRTSVRRHLRLVDYRLGEGCNAQAWARISLDGADTLTLDPRDIMLLPPLPGVEAPMAPAADHPLEPGTIVFEPDASVAAITLYADHDVIEFYDWSGGAQSPSRCCLPVGATSATLKDPGTIPPPPPPDDNDCTPDAPPPDIDAGVGAGQWHRLKLSPGDVLILAEIIGPQTGNPADADPMHRHPVRLTSVRPGHDPLNGQLVMDIAWCPEDALPFPLCLSAIGGPPDCAALSPVSVAWGNILPVDHGRSVADDLGRVGTARTEADCADACTPAETRIIPWRFRPVLPQPGLSFLAQPGDDGHACGGCGPRAATARGTATPDGAIPAVTLTDSSGARWLPRPDLLDSGATDRHFVVETEDDTATLRFGDDSNGRRPAAGETLRAHYRIGNGPAGNIGADALGLILFRNRYPTGVTLRITNPLPARGGTAPEALASAKLRAPSQFRRRLARAVTAKDYADIVMRDFAGQVQRAAASLRVSGVRTEVRVAIDPRGRAEPDPALLGCIARHLDGYRRIGHDVRVVAAMQVPVALAVRVCVAPDRIADHLRRAVRDALGTGPGGFFHPDALSFGTGIAISRILAALHAIDGVTHAEVTALHRLFEAPDGALESGLLSIGPLEIARLDQDPDAPENGQLTIVMGGGR